MEITLVFYLSDFFIIKRPETIVSDYYSMKKIES